MKRISVLAIVLLTVSPALLTAQNQSTRIGFGVALSQDVTILDNETITLPVSFNNFSVIIKSGAFRLEPHIGIFSDNYERTYESETLETSTSNYRLGLSAAYQLKSGEMIPYFGLGFGIIATSRTSTTSMSSSNTDESKTDFFIGPIAGGEYMLHKDFSLGGEIQLNYISVGHYEDATNVYDRTETIISTRALIFIRWYL